MRYSIFSLLIVLLPFLYQYNSPISFMSFAEFALAPFIMYYLVVYIRNDKVVVNKPHLWFLIITLFTTLLASFNGYFSFIDAATLLIRLVYYGLLIFVARKYFEFNKGIKFYLFFSTAFSIYLILQYLFHEIFSLNLPYYINHSWLFEYRTASMEEFYRHQFRPSSLFLEPGYFALYVGPALPFSLLKENKTKFLIAAIIISLALLMSTSSAGFGFLGLSWMCYFYKNYLRGNKNFYSFLKKLISFILMIIITFLLFNTDFFINSINRISSGGSFNVRILRSFFTYKDFSMYHKIIGTGINNIGNYVSSYNIYTPYDLKNLNYAASLGGTLLSSGLIGFIFLINFLVNTYKKQTVFYGKVLAILFVFTMFYESVLFTYRYAFIFILLESILYHTTFTKNTKYSSKRVGL